LIIDILRGCTPKEYETKITLLEGVETLRTTAGEQITKKAKSVARGVIADKQKGEAIRDAAMKTQNKRKGKYIRT